MPRIIRWFPVSHEINADPEMWELRETHGDRAGFVWLECLSIADRNEGVVGPASDQTRNQLASKCRTSRAKVGLILDWCRAKGWLVFNSRIRVAKYAKYHRTPEREKLPSEPSEPSEPNLTRPNKERNRTAQSDDFAALWILYPGKGSKKLALAQWEKLNPTHSLAEQILGAVRIQIAWRNNANGEFRPEWQDLHRWLRNRRWEDEQRVESADIEPYETPMEKLRKRRESEKKENQQ